MGNPGKHDFTDSLCTTSQIARGRVCPSPFSRIITKVFVFFGCVSLILIGCMVGVTTLRAQEPPGKEQFVYESIEVDWLIGVMNKEGYSVSEDADGDIEWKIDGYRTWIIFSESEEYLLFYAAFADTDSSLRKVNTWNSEVVYSRSYIDDDGDPNLEYPLRIKRGVTMDQIKDFVSLCRQVFDEWYSDVL